MKKETSFQNHPGLKKHHKWMIGGFGTIIIIFMVISGTMIYTLMIKQKLYYNELNNKIELSQIENQNRINILTENILQTKESLQALGSQVGSIDKEFDLLKAEASADFSGIIEESIKSVVTIVTDVGQGTGFIINEEGYLVTNAHVLSGATKILALNYEKEEYSAQFIGYDSILDLALLKIEGNFEKLNLGDSDEISVGEKVIAIGNPLGLQFSVSEGIVSGTHRPGPSGLETYIQTDASLNPGNSGGPLINKQGEAIGINNFKISGGESLGFALESNEIKKTVNTIFLKAMNETLI